MPYDNYIPQFYNPNTYRQPIMQQPQLNSEPSILWVQGENSAKAYPVTAGKSVILMDSENPVFYIKSTDQSGMPLPLRIFDYVERNQNGNQKPQVEKKDYISRDEFEKFKEEMRNEIRRPRKRPDEPVKENRDA